MSSTQESIVKKLIEIRDYIATNYPDSCIAQNDKVDVECELIKDVSEFFLYELIGFCGCGCKDTSAEAVYKYLRVCAFRSANCGTIKYHESCDKLYEAFNFKDVCDDPLLQFMAYILDDLELTEHGSSIAGAWITELGEMCMYSLGRYLNYDQSEDILK